jgi:D-serine deaminase-like pyridoxal phosphate-dependent protein
MRLTHSYFKMIEAALRKAGIGEPVLVIDQDLLDQNLTQFRTDLPAKMAYRIVAKSLPGEQLLRRVARKTRTNRLMSFNATMLAQLIRIFPQGDHMLGKPLALAAIAAFYAGLPGGLKAAGQKVHWLVDTPSRLRALDEFAASRKLSLNICLEIDVGLHRGGFENSVAEALAIVQHSRHVTLTSLLGYEPHLPKLPDIDGWPQKAKRASATRFKQVFDEVISYIGAPAAQHLIRNMAGSPTFRLYRNLDLANELAAGSVMVKPSDFDQKLLRAYHPACFIATPVLKVQSGVRLPAHELVETVLGAPAAGRTLFTHGGYWMADPIYPKGLGYNDMYGRSSNQEMMTAPSGAGIRPDDFVFLRPRQSEAIMLQFPHWAVYRAGRIVDMWSPLSVSV